MKDYERVSIDEAIKLAEHQTLGAFDYVQEVVHAAAQKEAAAFPTQSPSFNLMFGAFVAWEAGRVAGIRAERERRNTGRHKASEMGNVPDPIGQPAQRLVHVHDVQRCQHSINNEDNGAMELILGYRALNPLRNLFVNFLLKLCMLRMKHKTGGTM